jgi:hypothetical protein
VYAHPLRAVAPNVRPVRLFVPFAVYSEMVAPALGDGQSGSARIHVSPRRREAVIRNLLRWTVVLVTLLHGLIHFLGAAKGLRWAEIPALKEPIGTVTGLGWLVAATLLLFTAGLAAMRVDWWWRVALPAVLVSQIVIITSWNDARTGTLANVLLALAAGHGFASHGRPSLRARFHREVEAALATNHPRTDPVTDADLERLPGCVAGYLRRAGVVGQPRVGSFHATIHGRIRGGATQGWMPFTGEQVNTYGPAPTRQFFIDATRSGLPIDVLHVFGGGRASMQVRLCSVTTMVDSHGPELVRAETVTVFNDLCVLAPAALVDAPVTWQTSGERTARAAFTLGRHTITADLFFNDDHELVDFVSDDRSTSSAVGKTHVPQRWSTPISRYRDIGARHVAVYGEAHWHTAGPEGEFNYLDFRVDQIRYNAESHDTGAAVRQPAPAA